MEVASRIEIPAVAGGEFAGGIFAGRYFVGDKPFALIVAPADDGELAETKWGGSKSVAGAGSYCDGLANTKAMAEAKSELAKWALGLRIGGFDDWYIPSRLEALIAFGELGDKSVFAPEWYWTSTQYARAAGYAWYQTFYYGRQLSHGTGIELEDAPGVVTLINVQVSKGQEGNEQWSELEFCPSCSRPMLEHIRPALDYRDKHPV